jgi:uncharacterized protein (DUF934 family)
MDKQARDANWKRFDETHEAVREAKENLRIAEHNYHLATANLRRAEAESHAIWIALTADVEARSHPSFP